MNKEFLTASLKLTAINPVTEKKTTVTLNDLTQDAPVEDVEAVRGTGISPDQLDASSSWTLPPVGNYTLP